MPNGDILRLMIPQPVDFKLIFREKKEASDHDAYSFFFTATPQVEFLSGQYLKMTLPIKTPDDRGDSRYFTIASSPTEKGKIQVTTRIIQSAFKKTLRDNIVPEQEISANGPYGRFFQDWGNKTPRVFLAGGIGVTPFRSMIRFAVDSDLEVPITLVNSWSLVEDIVFFDEFLKIEKSQKNFFYIPTVTKMELSKKPWDGQTGRIDQQMLKHRIANWTDSDYYIVGPSNFVSTMFSTVRDMGIPMSRIKTENFPGY